MAELDHGELEDQLDPAESFVLQHLYRPQPGELLYHYCSMQSFEAIVRTGKLRMSDINMMNDSAEMRWGYQVFETAVSKILLDRAENPGLPDKPFFDELDRYLSPANLVLHPLIACFSRNGDVLSQWRAYANDGSGVAIGFDAAKLTNIAATFLNCEYDAARQIERMKARLVAAHSIVDEFPLVDHAMNLFGCFPSMKHPSFREEAEVRAVHLLSVSVNEDGIALQDPGGQAFGKQVGGAPVGFAIRKNDLVAYVDLPFVDEVSDRVIKEIILGPKNHNAWTNISALLVRHGHKGVNITASGATYR